MDGVFAIQHEIREGMTIVHPNQRDLRDERDFRDPDDLIGSVVVAVALDC